MSIVLLGSTSGSCTLQEQAVAGNTILTLPTTSGTLITTGSSGQSIPRAALPAGSVLQVVSATYASESTTNSSTFQSTGLTASITPTSSSSKIYIVASFLTYTTGAGRYTIYRNSSNVVAAALGQNSTSAGDDTITISYLDSPATTSSTTYTVYMRAISGNVYIAVNSLTCVITLMEIAA